eukprot:GEMP01007899.1.p1 GENE.GEMP01007899.1~~GEMP01007899.1.p1  ORF type:complete len:926 (+),score=191.22 GEMP01007899.1:113-2890(+)
MEVRERLTGVSFLATSQSGEVLLGTGAKEKYGLRWVPLIQKYSFAVGLYSDIFRLRSEFRQTEVFSDVIAALRHLSKLYVLIPLTLSRVESVANILAYELKASGFDDNEALKEFLDLPGWNASSLYLRVDADEGTVVLGRKHLSSPALVQALDALFLSSRMFGIGDTIRWTWKQVEMASVSRICQMASPLRPSPTRHARSRHLSSADANADSVVVCGGVLRVMIDALKENREKEQGSDGSSMTSSSGRNRFRRKTKVWVKRVFELHGSVPGSNVAHLIYKSVKHIKKRKGTLCFDSLSEVRRTSPTSFSFKLRTGNAMTFVANNEEEVKLWVTHLEDVISCLGKGGQEEKTEEHAEIWWPQVVAPSVTAVGAFIFCQLFTAILFSLIVAVIAFFVVPTVQRRRTCRDSDEPLEDDNAAEPTPVRKVKRKLTCDSKFQSDDPREMVASERFRYVLRKTKCGRRLEDGLPPMADRTDDLLLKFLRFVDPSLASFVEIDANWQGPAQMATQFAEYIEAKSNNKLLEHIVGEPSERIRELYDLNFMRVLPRARDRNGCRILLVTPANLPKDVPLEDIELIVGYFLVNACLDEGFLSPGFLTILDLSKISKTSAWAISKRFTKKIAHAIAPKDAIPINVQKVIFVNYPNWVQLLWTVLKTFFLDKRYHDVAVYCRNCDDLHKFIDPAELPAQLGGADADDEKEWIDDWMLRNAQVLLGKTQKDAECVVELENYLQMEDNGESTPLTKSPLPSSTLPIDIPDIPSSEQNDAARANVTTAVEEVRGKQLFDPPSTPRISRATAVECVTQEGGISAAGDSSVMEHRMDRPGIVQGAARMPSSGSACSPTFPRAHLATDTALSADELSEEPAKMDNPREADAETSISAEGISKRTRVSKFLSPTLHKAKNAISQSKNSIRHRLGRNKTNTMESH